MTPVLSSLLGMKGKKAVIEKTCERDEDIIRPTGVSQMYFEPEDFHHNFMFSVLNIQWHFLIQQGRIFKYFKNNPFVKGKVNYAK